MQYTDDKIITKSLNSKFPLPPRYVLNQQSTRRSQLISFQNRKEQYQLHDALKTIRAQKNDVYSKQGSCHSSRVVQEKQITKGQSKNDLTKNKIDAQLLQVLRQENENLKRQNNFLIQRIRTMEKKNKEIQEDYKIQIFNLQKCNQALKINIEELIHLIKESVEPFSDKIQSLNQEIMAEKNQILPFLSRENLNFFEDKKYIANQTPTATNSNNQSELEQLNNKFEALLYSCKLEKIPENRKEIRKKLVEVTEKMRFLKKKDQH